MRTAKVPHMDFPRYGFFVIDRQRFKKKKRRGPTRKKRRDAKTPWLPKEPKPDALIPALTTSGERHPSPSKRQASPLPLRSPTQRRSPSPPQRQPRGTEIPPVHHSGLAADPSDYKPGWRNNLVNKTY
eukprot:gene7967-2792_t